MKPRIWAAAIGGVLTVLVAAALVVAEDHDTPANPSAEETTTTTTAAVVGYGLVWHIGETGFADEPSPQQSIAVANGLLYSRYSDNRTFQVFTADMVTHFWYRYNDPNTGYGEPDRFNDPERGTIRIYTDHPSWGKNEIISLHDVSDLAGLVQELEREIGD